MGNLQRIASGTMTGCTRRDDDGNGDGAVDQMDFEHFELCFSGPGGTPPLNCDCFDSDADEDVDCVDWWAFEDNWTGPPASPPEDVGCPDCYCGDLNQDEWVNLTDFSTFQVLFGAVSTSVPPDCAAP